MKRLRTSASWFSSNDCTSWPASRKTPRRRHVEAAEDVHQRRLARARRPGDRDELALVDAQRHVAQRRDLERRRSRRSCRRRSSSMTARPAHPPRPRAVARAAAGTADAAAAGAAAEPAGPPPPTRCGVNPPSRPAGERDARPARPPSGPLVISVLPFAVSAGGDGARLGGPVERAVGRDGHRRLAVRPSITARVGTWTTSSVALGGDLAGDRRARRRTPLASR